MTQMHIDDEIELVIDTLAFGGEGVGHIPIDGENVKKLAVFVEETVSGDVIVARIGAKKRNFARGYVKKLVKPSPLRIQPRCRHFGQNGGEDSIGNGLKPPPPSEKGCGGCFWQFLAVKNQLKFKEQHVRDVLQRIGGIKGDVVLPIIAGEPWFYRNKMEFSFSRTIDSVLTLGLHLKRRHYDVVELTECFLLEPFVGELVETVRNFFRKLDTEKALGDNTILHTFTVRVGKNSGQMMLILSASGESFSFRPQLCCGPSHQVPEGLSFLQEFQEAILGYCKQKKLPLTSLYFVHITNQKGRPKFFKEELLWGKPAIDEFLHLPGADQKQLYFEISPSAFFQPNTRQAEKLYANILEAAALTGKEVVLDLYCGTGTIGLFCAGISGAGAKKVYGIELNAMAVENARRNAARNNIDNIEFFAGDVQKILSSIREKPDVVLVDPPRCGLAPKVVEKIADLKPKRFVYVSCNPAALARDAKIFIQNGFTLASVRPIDMFPQTYHIESVALFRT